MVLLLAGCSSGFSTSSSDEEVGEGLTSVHCQYWQIATACLKSQQAFTAISTASETWCSCLQAVLQAPQLPHQPPEVVNPSPVQTGGWPYPSDEEVGEALASVH